MPKKTNKPIDLNESTLIKEEEKQPKEFRKYFTYNFYKDKFNEFLLRFVKNENKTLGLYFLKRKFWFWSSVLINLVGFTILLVSCILALLLPQKMLTTDYRVLIIIFLVFLIFMALYFFIRTSERYSYKMQRFWKKLFIVFVPYSWKAFYFNSTLIHVFTFSSKMFDDLRIRFNTQNIYEKTFYTLKYNLELEKKLKGEQFVEVVSTTQNQTLKDLYPVYLIRNFKTWIKNPFSKSPIYQEVNQEVNQKPIINQTIYEEKQVFKNQEKQAAEKVIEKKPKPSRKKQRGGPKKPKTT